MDFGSIEEIEQQGFSGFVAVSLLRESACRQVSEVPGVYLVIRPEWQPPSFLDHSTGGHFKGREPSVSIQELQQAWVTGTVVIYIGKAYVLRRRLHSYTRFGDGESAPHWSGRYVWQLADAADLLVCWKETPDEDPRQVEQRLIQKFRVRYGKRPFANLRD
jgi:excinuclease UvrABC nuclease subunit